MALSNWDTFAVNEKGESVDGSFVSPHAVVVDIYKNWLYVSDEKAWEEGGGFVRPVVMEIQEGHIRYKDMHIYAVRGPQQGIYCAVWIPRYVVKRVTGKDKILAVFGCGVYGYEEDGEFVGVKQESLEFLKNMIKSLCDFESPVEFLAADLLCAFAGKDVNLYDCNDIGEFVLSEEATVALAGYFKKIGVGVRYNQGDAYISGKLGCHTPNTAVGKAETTLLSQGLKELGKETKKDGGEE